MDVFVLLFIVSFLALILTLAVMHISKCMNKGNGDVTVSDVATKWKETLLKHSTRIKLRNSRKLRNKRKGKK